VWYSLSQDLSTNLSRLTIARSFQQLDDQPVEWARTETETETETENESPKQAPK